MISTIVPVAFPPLRRLPCICGLSPGSIYDIFVSTSRLGSDRPPLEFSIFIPCLAAPLGLPQGDRVAPKDFDIPIFMSNGQQEPEQ